ncbi:hypothetical protein P8452_43045 [Trifolium repens]|nr:hypothetical protein P8452_43045 [Trifolium repens]
MRPLYCYLVLVLDLKEWLHRRNKEREIRNNRFQFFNPKSRHNSHLRFLSSHIISPISRFFMSSDRSRDSISHSRLAPSLNNKIGLHNLLVFRWAGKVQALTSSYYIGAQEIILVYDGTR